jgi:hypothetical protein
MGWIVIITLFLSYRNYARSRRFAGAVFLTIAVYFGALELIPTLILAPIADAYAFVTGT